MWNLHMNFGPHSALVEEILASIDRGEILSAHVSVSEPDTLVVHDLNEAKRYAWSRPIADDESSTWNDLREDEVAPFHAMPYEHPESKPAYDATDGLLPQLLALPRALRLGRRLPAGTHRNLPTAPRR
jgi:hypothetical protein